MEELEGLPHRIASLLSMISFMPENRRDFVLGFLVARHPDTAEDALVELSQKNYFSELPNGACPVRAGLIR